MSLTEKTPNCIPFPSRPGVYRDYMRLHVTSTRPGASLFRARQIACRTARTIVRLVTRRLLTGSDLDSGDVASSSVIATLPSVSRRPWLHLAAPKSEQPDGGYPADAATGWHDRSRPDERELPTQSGAARRSQPLSGPAL